MGIKHDINIEKLKERRVSGFKLPKLFKKPAFKEATKQSVLILAKDVCILDNRINNISNELFSDEQRVKFTNYVEITALHIFEKNFHAARNSLAVIVEQLKNDWSLPIDFKPPKGVDLEQLKNIGYYDKKTGKDLWDTIHVTYMDTQGKKYSFSGLDLSIVVSLNQLVSLSDDRRNEIAKKIKYRNDIFQIIVDIADTLKEENIRKERYNTLYTKYVKISSLMGDIDPYKLREEMPNGLNDKWREKLFEEADRPDTLTYDGALILFILGWPFEYSDYNRHMIAKDWVNADESLDLLEELLEMWVEFYVDICIQLVVDQLEDLQISQDRDLVEYLGKCIKRGLGDQYEESMKKWGGAYKWVGVAVCGLSFFIELIVTFGAGAPAAVVSLVLCLCSWMCQGFTGTLETIGDIVDCVKIERSNA
ncbi:MAG: hypothetical protein ACTSXD_00850 [Candidatus Heimdallarchaeaceae archaeon]